MVGTRFRAFDVLIGYTDSSHGTQRYHSECSVNTADYVGYMDSCF